MPFCLASYACSEILPSLVVYESMGGFSFIITSQIESLIIIIMALVVPVYIICVSSIVRFDGTIFLPIQPYCLQCIHALTASDYLHFSYPCLVTLLTSCLCFCFGFTGYELRGGTLFAFNHLASMNTHVTRIVITLNLESTHRGEYSCSTIQITTYDIYIFEIQEYSHSCPSILFISLTIDQCNHSQSQTLCFQGVHFIYIATLKA